MAKKDTKLDTGFDDFDLDAELAKLDDFGMGEAHPPKNKREAVLQSLKDTAKGATDEFKPNLNNASKFLKAGMPNSLRTEYADINDALFGPGGIKETINKGLSDVRQAGKGLQDSLKSILPKDGKLHKTVDKIGKFLKLDSGSLEDQMKANNDRLIEGIKNELQNSFTRESTMALLQTTVQQRQNKSMLEVLNTIQDNTTIIKTFHIEVTNNYYRKSLELQYKQLFTAKEQLEMTRKMYDTFKNQYDTIVLNTGLPEFVKIKRSEAFVKTARQSMDQSVQKFLFQDLSTVKKLKENVSRRIKYGFESFLQGLGMAGQMADGAAMMKDMGDIGPSKSYMLGSTIGGWTRDLFANQIGERLARTEKGKKAVFNIKNAFSDPSGFASSMLQKLSKQKKPDSKIGKYGRGFLEWGLRNMRDLGAAGGDYTGVMYGKQDPKDVAVFDNRTQTSIVKVIPGLLNKIYGELRSKRDGSDPDSHELIYDYTRQTLTSKNQYISNFKSDYKKKLKARTDYDIKVILGYYKEYGGFKEDELDIIGACLLSYIITPAATINPTSLISIQFLKNVPTNLRIRTYKAGKAIMKAAMEEPYIVESITGSLSAIRRGIPSLEDEIDSLYTTGNVNIAQELGLVTRDELYQTHAVNKAGVLGFITNSYKDNKYGGGYHIGKIDSSKDIAGMKGNKSFLRKLKTTKRLAGRELRNVKTKVVNGYVVFGNKVKIKYEDLRKEYFASKDYNSGLVKDFPEWVSSVTGEDVETLREELIKGMGDSKDKIKSAKDDLMGGGFGISGIASNINSKFQNDVVKGMFGKEVTLDELREKFYQSEEYQSGAIQDFPTWLKGLGLGPDGKNKSNSLFWKILKTTHAIDRWAFKKTLALPWYGTKALWKVSKFGAKIPFKTGAMGFAGRSLGMAAAGVPLQMINMTREAFGKEALNYGPSTWGMDRSLARGTAKIGGVLSRIRNFGAGILKFTKGNRNQLANAGAQVGASPSEQVMMAGLDGINAQLAEMRPKKNPFDKDGSGRRDGSWLDRLNIFKKKDKTTKEGSKNGNKVLEFMKENKGLTVMGGLMLASGLLKSIGLSTEEIVSGVKTTISVLKSIGSGIVSVVKGIYGIGKTIGDFISGGINKVKSFFGFDTEKKQKLDKDGNPMVDESGNPVYEEENSTLGNILGTTAVTAAGYMAYKAIKSPIKTVTKTLSFGWELVNAVVKYLRGSWIPGTGKIADALTSSGSKIAGMVDKFCGSIKDLVSKLGKIKNALTKPAIIKRVGKRAATKAVGKITTMIASAATGVGGLLTAAMALWELGWTLWYMYDKKIGFWNALSYQLLGVDIVTELENENKANSEAKKIGDAVDKSDKVTYTDEDGREVSIRRGDDGYYVEKQSADGSKMISLNNMYTNGRGMSLKDLKENRIDMDMASEATRRYINNQKQAITQNASTTTAGAPSPTIAAAQALGNATASKVKQLAAGELPFKVKRGDWQNLHPELLKRWTMMAEDYYNRTGQKLIFDGGKRSLQQQQSLYAKYGPGRAAKPNPLAPHIAGVAIDGDSTQMEQVDKMGLLAKYGLTRPLKNGLGRTTKEPWHVELAEARDSSKKITTATLASIGNINPDTGNSAVAINDPASQDATADGAQGVSPKDIKVDNQENTMVASNSGTTTKGGTSISSISSAPGVSMASDSSPIPSPSYASISTATPAVDTTTVSAPQLPHPSSVFGTISDTLTQQLRVQMNIAEGISELVKMGGGSVSTYNQSGSAVSGSPSTGQSPTAEYQQLPTPPNPSISLSRETYI